jgi:hypothetical protein
MEGCFQHSLTLVAGCPQGTEFLCKFEVLRVLQRAQERSPAPTEEETICGQLVSCVECNSRVELTLAWEEHLEGEERRPAAKLAKLPMLTSHQLEWLAELVSSLWRLRSTEWVGLLVAEFDFRRLGYEAPSCPTSTTESEVVQINASGGCAWNRTELENAVKDGLAPFETQLAAAVNSIVTPIMVRKGWMSQDDRDEVMFRVNAVRLSNSGGPSTVMHEAAVEGPGGRYFSFTQSEVGEDIGWALGLQHPSWKVSLRYYSHAFMALYDEPFQTGDTGSEAKCWVCVVLHEPNLPKMEKEKGNLDLQLAFMDQRRQIRRQLLRGEVNPMEMKHTIPQPGHFKNDIRMCKGQNAMHPALAHLLVSLVDIGEGDVLLDPMAGCGSTLVEALLETWTANGSGSPEKVKGIHCIAGEAEHKQGTVLIDSNIRTQAALWERGRKCGLLADAVSSTASFNSTTTVVRWSAERLPLRDSTIDAIVCDLPFGLRCGNKEWNQRFYPQLLSEMYRVIRKGIRMGRHSSPTPHNLAQKDSEERLPHWTKNGRIALLTPDVDLIVASLANQSNVGQEAAEDSVCGQSATPVSKAVPLRIVATPWKVDMSGQFPYVVLLEPV